MRWMDLLRGAAIFLVFLMHSPDVPVLLGYELPVWMERVNDFFRPFRMPMLMLLSGMLLDRSLIKPLKQYYAGKLSGIVWPYLVWAGLHISLYGGLYEQGLSLGSPRSWIATSYLWFMFYVASYFIVAPALRRVPPVVLVIGAFAISVAVSHPILESFFYHAGFFFAGQIVSRYPALLQRLTSRWSVAAMATVALTFGIISATFGASLSRNNAFFAVFSMCGILTLIACASRLPESELTRLIEFIGRNSLIFYAAHFPVMLAIALMAQRLGLTSMLPVATACFVVAWAVSFGLAALRGTVPFVWLFQAPGYMTLRSKRIVKS
jgi:uncharacterized membrane protein YcfT